MSEASASSGPSGGPRTLSISTECFLAAAAASSACLFTNPLEVVKTRMQLQGELKARGEYARHYRNVFQAFYTIARHEGLRSLQKGLVPGIWFQVCMNGPRLGIYQTLDNLGFLREVPRTKPSGLGGIDSVDPKPTGSVAPTEPASPADNKGAKHDDRAGVIFYRSVAAAAFSGVVGVVFGSPFYMVKTQLQSQSAQSISVGFQHAHSSMTRALVDVARTRGFLALWTGVTAAIPRVMVGSSVQLTTFSYAKQLIEGQDFSRKMSTIARTFLASLTSGVIVVIFMTPFDVITTRIYNQPVAVAADCGPT